MAAFARQKMASKATNTKLTWSEVAPASFGISYENSSSFRTLFLLN